VGLLNEAASVPDPSLIKPLQERFVAAGDHANKLVAQLPATVDGGALKSLTERLIAFGASAENVFDLRREELRQTALAQAISNLVFEGAIDAGHNDLYDHPAFAAAVREALARIEAASGEALGR